MGLPCLKPLPLCKPRDPQASDLWRLLDGHFETFREIYSEQFQAKYGFSRPVVDRSAAAFLTVWGPSRRQRPKPPLDIKASFLVLNRDFRGRIAFDHGRARQIRLGYKRIPT